MREIVVVLVVVVAGFLSSWTGVAAQPAPLRVAASNGVKAALEALLGESEQRVGRPVETTFRTSATTRTRIVEGEAFDVAILTADVIDELTRTGKIASGSGVVLGRSGIGIGVRAGAPKPDIATAAALRRALVGARSLTYADDGASRVHITKMLDAFGIADAVKSKTALEQGSVRATARVARGETELVITLISEILPVPRIELVGPLPAEFQSYVSFAAGLGSRAQDPEAARALITFLSGPGARRAFAVTGIERP